MKIAERFYRSSNIEQKKLARLKGKLKKDRLKKDYYIVYYNDNTTFVLEYAMIEELRKIIPLNGQLTAVGITETEDEAVELVAEIVGQMVHQSMDFFDRSFFKDQSS